MKFKRVILLGIVCTCLTIHFAGVVISLGFASLLSSSAMMGEETIGNKPFGDANFQDWPKHHAGPQQSIEGVSHVGQW